ncbi:MAG: folate family ECF transporter S component [Oscillospiraceae bacterium]|nr:folate family ECF transporter S component [Oscillospiraceae bacterium]
MKSFFSTFKDSAAELKNIRCLTVTGILVAIFIILDMFSIRIGDFIKVNFAFVALASVGMLFGPVTAMLAALAGDLIGCILSGQAPLPLLSLTAVSEGLLYGIMLYKKTGTKLVTMSVISRVIDSAVISLILNTVILQYYGFMSTTAEQFYIRCGKIGAELIVFIPLVIIVMPAVYAVYSKIFRIKPQT